MNNRKRSPRKWPVVLLTSLLLLGCAIASAYVARWRDRSTSPGAPPPPGPAFGGFLTAVNADTGLFFFGLTHRAPGEYWNLADARVAAGLKPSERTWVESVEQPGLVESLISPISENPPGKKFQAGSTIEEMYYGWPFPFAGHRVEGKIAPRIPIGAQTLQNTTDLVVRSQGTLWDPAVPLPFTHIWWPNFIFNFLAWQTLLLAFPAYAVFKILRNRRRIKHLRCVQCAYTIAGLEACPECGTPVPARTLAPVSQT
jgi:hypothetical protein